MDKFVEIPKGEFYYSVTKRNEKVDKFYLGQKAVTAEFWNKAAKKAVMLGYDICKATGEGELPAGNITWFDAVKFCNALSEIAGRKCVYYTSDKKDEVYKTGELDISESCIDENADGFYLPREFEWEYACKAGTETAYFWGDTLDFRYVYSNSASPVSVIPHKSGVLPQNPFGLYDMNGNVHEWCFDKHLNYRILRGGSVALDSECHSEKRNFCYPEYHLYETGVRIATKKNIDSFKIEACEATLTHSTFAHSERYTAFNFLNELNLQGEVEAEYLKGNYEKAIQLYRDNFVNFIKERNVYCKPHWFVVIPKKEEIDYLYNFSGDIKWFKTSDGDDSIPSHGNFHCLYVLWEETGDITYFEKWLWYANHRAVFYKEQFDKLPYSAYELKTEYGRPQAWDCFMGFNDKSEELLHYLNNAIIKLSDSECEEYITADIVKNFLLFCRYYNIELVIKDPRSTVSNQMIFTNKLLIGLSDFMKDFKDCKNWKDLAFYRIKEEWLQKSYLPDGSDMEQAYNYNGSLVKDFVEIKKLIGDSDKDLSDTLDKYISYRQRMLASVIKPFGGRPATATMYDIYPPLLNEETKKWAENSVKANSMEFSELCNDKIADGIYENILKNNGNVPFKSICFPYGGYNILRDGWNYDSLYMWQIFSRKGMGHSAENINSINVAAYGRNFLISCGAESYKHPEFVAYDQKPYMDLIDAYQESSFGWNTVVVNGCGQKRYENGQNQNSKAYTAPIGNRFHISDKIEMCEGIYNGDYVGEQGRINAMHTRQIYFIKPYKLWICVDIMNAPQNSAFTQIWHFPGMITHEYQGSVHQEIEPFSSKKYGYDIAGFSDKEIITDKENKRIYTVQKNAPNLFMYHLADNVEYERYFGSLNPTAGWQSPGFKGRRFPKTDVRVNFKDKRFATVIAPSENEDSHILKVEKTANGLKIKTVYGEIIYSENEYISENLKIKADTVIVCGNFGIVIGGKETKYPDFEFEIINGEIKMTPVQRPEGFQWGKDGKPNYKGDQL